MKPLQHLKICKICRLSEESNIHIYVDILEEYKMFKKDR